MSDASKTFRDRQQISQVRPPSVLMSPSCYCLIVYIYTCMYIYIQYIYVCMCVYVCICMSCVYKFIYLFICMYKCMYMCMCIYSILLYFRSIYIFIWPQYMVTPPTTASLTLFLLLSLTQLARNVSLWHRHGNNRCFYLRFNHHQLHLSGHCELMWTEPLCHVLLLWTFGHRHGGDAAHVS